MNKLGTLLLVSALAWQGQALAANAETRARASSNVSTLGDISADVEAEIAFGRDVAARILGRLHLANAPELNDYLNLVGNAVAQQGNRPELTYRFALLQSDSINAYAAPGGYIFVTTGAFAMMQDEAELAAVLAHELAHINQKHVVTELQIRGADKAPEAGLSRLIGGMADPTRLAFMQTVDKAVDILFDSGLKQRDEFEADRLGVITASLAGYDPLALSRYLGRLEAIHDNKTSVLYKTHPPMAERRRAIDAVLEKDGLRRLTGATGESRFAEMKVKLQ